MRSATAVLVLVSLFSGCSQRSSDTPELAVVSGVVTLDGQPLPNVTVAFVPTQGAGSYGVTDESGKYELNAAGGNQGAIVGTHTVTITTPTDGPPGPGYKDPVPAKYNTKSTLTVDVKPGKNPDTNFELTSGK